MAEVDAFARFAALLRTEDGSPLVLEEWQLEVVGDIFTALETLVLLPKGNGKTAMLAALALFHLTTTPNAAVYVAAASRDQASLLYGYAHGFLARSPELQERLLARPGYREIRTRRSGDLGLLKVLASDADTSDGVAPTLALVDELHRHKSPDLYATFRDGLSKRSGSLVTISTAGWDEESSPLGRLRRAAFVLPEVKRDGAHLRTASTTFVLHEWALEAGADPDDLEAVKRANPSRFVTLEDLAARHDSPSMARNDWLRFACNVWTTGAEEWIGPEAWDALADPDREVPEGSAVVIGFDGSYSGDSTAAIGVLIADVPHVFVVGLWAGEGDEIDIVDVEQCLVEAGQRYHVTEFAADPFRWARSLQILFDSGLPIVNFPQNASHMAPATSRFGAAVATSAFTHDGNPELRQHVLNAVLVSDYRGERVQKRSKRSPQRIDAAVAALMAYDRAMTSEDASRELERQRRRKIGVA